MKNARIVGGEVLYDCEGVDCPTPNEPHSIDLHTVMAALDASCHEFIHSGDPRSEAIDVALQLLYQQFYANGDTTNGYPSYKDAPWSRQYKQIVTALHDHYGHSADDDDETSTEDDKEWLN